MPLSPHRVAIGVCLVPALTWAASTTTGLPATLELKAKLAFTNISKAKSALNAGNSKTSQSYLAKSQQLLKSVLNEAPTGSAQTTQGTASAQQPNEGTAPAQQNSSFNAISQAEQEAAKLDPSLAARAGLGRPQAAQPSGADAGTAGGDTAAPHQGGKQSILTELQGTYQKVTMAQSLLKAGNSTQAKGILDGIPSSPLSLLKSASGL